MARPRTPTATLKLKGSFKTHPERLKARAGEPKPSGILGDPPEDFKPNEKAAWFELSSIAPPQVLTNADRWSVELACKIMARFRSGGVGGRDGITTSELAQLVQLLGRMGMTPADRSRISVPQRAEEDNPFAKIAAEAAPLGPRPN